MTFVAWCIRDHGFDYRIVRRHGGIAFFPLWESGKLIWTPNKNYYSGTLIEKNAGDYSVFADKAANQIITAAKSAMGEEPSCKATG